MDTTKLESRVRRVLLRPEEVAFALGVSRSTAYKMIATGALPSVRVAGVVRVPAAAVEALGQLEENPEEARQ